MIKVHSVMSEGFFKADTARRTQENALERQTSGDIVTISDEGKKKRVMGHVMASLSGPDTRKA